MKFQQIIIPFILALCVMRTAPAVLIINVYEANGYIIYSGFGSLVLDEAVTKNNSTGTYSPGFHSPVDGRLSTSLNDVSFQEFSNMQTFAVEGEENAWGAQTWYPGTSEGDAFLLDARPNKMLISLPADYASGEAISFTITVRGSFESNHPNEGPYLNEGLYRWEVGSDEVYLSVGETLSSVPEPSTYASLAGASALALCILFRRGRSK
ncbi:PEP-CTERM sorting domain-containing protein [Cerasicoccus frondis]|uniref:PEP-CTERM sorting domain-containing protein n=1 Tax=Cerasicoccus frondis TaxID=490090 RepID=UPI002852D7CF|nr:PEP-CTERM sorting domain-containing protein [Cerasicoccus frondis]